MRRVHLMNDKIKILIGFIVFIVLFSSPFWLNFGNSAPAPEPVLSAKAKKAGKCVESKEYMKAEHMQILDTWRDTVVRGGERIYVAKDGTKMNMSLSSGENSCLGCHEDKAEFCDKCHDYASVKPYCWDCHIDPKENK